MRHSLEAFLPDWEVAYLAYPTDDPASVAAFLNELRDADAWACADSYPKFVEFAAQVPQVQSVRWPQVVFPAFHPDVVLAWQDGRQVQACGHVYHSAIVLWGFLNGMDEKAVFNLFNRQTFQSLGYLDQWAPSIKALNEQFKSCGLDFELYYRAVKRVGVFMHSHDHAKITSIMHVARQVAEKIGGADPAYVETASQILDDALMHDAIWPVYPDIALHYGLAGSYAWRLKNKFYNSLESYLARAFASYVAVGACLEKTYCERLRTSDLYDRALSVHR